MKHLILLSCLALFFLSGCVSQKKYAALNARLNECQSALTSSKQQVTLLNKEVAEGATRQQAIRSSKDEVIAELRTQIEDLKKQRDQQFTQVDDLTVLSQSANENISQTLKQLEKKDGYIKYLLAAKSKADSLNLALSLNLKSVLRDGIEDEDIEVEVDKTVVFINLSDKMLFKSGSHTLTTRAREVLSKIAKIIHSKPELEVMVEGHTDNVPIESACIKDNWDLSVKRAASVVRVLQTEFEVDPTKLIAAGRSEYVSLAENTTEEGRSTNRRTRIILLPKLGQFYDLLKPGAGPETE